MTEATPWLDDMLADVGVHEIAGPKANAKILAYFADVGHPECKSDEIAWCAARVGSALVRAGYPIPPANVNLMARSYCTYGVASEPKPGAIVVFPRGSSDWQGHVGCVTEVNGDIVKYITGNQSDQVGYGKGKVSDALCFRWPVKATIADLRKSGSTEIKKGDRVQNVGTFMTFIGPIIAAVRELLAPITAVPPVADIHEGLTYWQKVLGGANAVSKVVLENPWLAGVVFSGLALAWIGHTIKKQRVAKAQSGVPLSTAVASLGSA